MGCAASAPQDVDTLPIKAHCRTAFSRCSTTEHVNGQAAENNLSNQSEDGHDVVLCYPLGGTVFGLELQARYEKMDAVSLWTLDHFLSAPGSPVCVSKSTSDACRSGGVAEPALEIKPVPEGAAAFAPSNVALCREVRTCRRGVVVLVTAGCTWDDGVLTCLRLVGRFLRPLVLVHCVQSCPLPSLEEWPPDVRPLIAACGPPIKYLAQHSTEALRHAEQRMVQAAAALAAAAAVPEASRDPQQGQQGQGQQQGQGKQQEGKQQEELQGEGQAEALQVHGKQGQGAASIQTAHQQQPAGVATSECGCLDSEIWWPPRRQPQQPAQPQAQSKCAGPTGPAVAATGAAPPPQPEASATATGPASSNPLADGGPGAAPGTDAGPLSLAALQASNSDICRRASQLLGPWTSSVTPQHPGSDSGSGTAAGPVGASANTLVEALVISARPSYSTMPSAKGTACAVGPDAPARPPPPQPPSQQQQGQLRPHAQAQTAQRSPNEFGGASGGGGCGPRCVLRYRDPCWATPVAFVCAQLEAELGRANVNVRAGAPSPAGQKSPAPAAGTSVRVSLQSMDSGGHWSHTWRRQTQQQEQQQQQQQQQASVSAAAAAAAALRGPHRSSSGSSSRCSASGGGGAGARQSESTSRRTSGAVSAAMARIDDDLEPYVTRPTDDCTTPLLAATSVSSSTRSAAAASAAVAPLAEFQSGSWPEDALGPQPDGTGAGVAACLVHFVTPGLSAPLPDLTEVGAGLAAGRRAVLVVDGECGQRLPDYAPAGTTPEVWKALKRLWQERLLYVPDYHTPFCVLLKQGIVGTTSSP